MKRILFASLLLVAFNSASFSKEFVAEGKTHTSLGDFRISVSDKPITIEGQELKTYVISYQNSPMEVTVAIMKSKKCKNYVVLSNKLSIQYVCNKDYFGVQKLDEPLNKEGFTTSDDALNRTEYFHQKLIAPGQQDELVSTELIAAYFPRLIKDELVAIK